MAAPVIQVENLGKQYKIGLRDDARRSFGEALVHSLGAPFRRLRTLSEKSDGGDLFWALRDVSFDVQPGEVIGIIGRNGAGKSTLLKILSRITEPTTGRAELRGSVRSLLEVGTGFHGELTGRENIYLNGAILGMKKAEIDAHFDEIVAFADIDRFLDTPVKRYSSGMYVRLAFAVAAHLQPEILLVDEVLAVGDAVFQKKCLGTMRNVAGSGRTVLFVSHNMAAVSQICTRAILLDSGEKVFDGPAEETVRKYLGQQQTAPARATFALEPDTPMQITSMALESASGEPISEIDCDQACVLSVGYLLREPKAGTYVCVAVTTETGLHVLFSTDVQRADELTVARRPGYYEAQVEIPGRVLAPGTYYCSAAICTPGGGRPVHFRERPICLKVTDNDSVLARFGINHPAVTLIPMQWRTHYVGTCSGDSLSQQAEVAVVRSGMASATIDRG
ncbi:MAG: ABC transporter ATP-binding protein [Phycisphaerae bacterium]